MTDLEILITELREVLDAKQKAETELAVLRDRETELRRRISAFQPAAPVREEKNKEKLLGENIFGKIGIIITVIGLIALLKYLFDRGLFSTEAKIAGGYLISAAAVYFAYFFRKKRKVLASVLFTGAISFSYSLTFVCLHYFEVFNGLCTLIISLLIAVFSCVVGYLKNNVLFGFSVVIVFLAPALSGYYLTGGNFGQWTAFVLFLDLASCGVSYLKQNRVGINAAFFTTVLFVAEVFLDTPESGKNFVLFLTFFVIFFIGDLLLKNRQSTFFNIINTLFTVLFFAVIGTGEHHGAYYDFVISACFLAAALLLKNSYKWLYFAVFTFDFALFLILKDFHFVHLTLLVFAFEALLFLGVFKKNNADFFEKMSFNLLVASVLSVVLVLDFYYDGKYRPFFNSAFLSLIILAVLCVLFYKNYSRERFSSYSEVFVFLVIIVAFELETAFYPEFSHPLLLSLLAAVYALGVFVFGAKKDSPLLRRFAIVLAIMTAVKIILCDVSENSLALKAAVFITEGGIFLLFSYLYSKYFKK